jgi:hypothetical protein
VGDELPLESVENDKKWPGAKVIEEFDQAVPGWRHGIAPRAGPVCVRERLSYETFKGALAFMK